MFFSLDKILSLLRLLKKAFSQYRWQIVSLTILSFLSGILEGLGLNAIIPLFSFLNKTPGTDFISKMIERFFIFFNFTYSLRTLLIFIVILFLLKAGLLFLSKYISVAITTNYEQNTRAALWQTTLSANWNWLVKQKIGHLDQILITDVNNSSAMLAHVSSTILILANLLIYSLVVINISPLIAGLTLLAGLAVFIFFQPIFYKNKMLAEKTAGLYKRVANYVSENILGMKIIKAMGLESRVGDQGQEYFYAVRSVSVKSALWRALTSTLLQPVGLIFIVGVFAWFYKFSGFNFASFAVVVYAINKLFAHIQLAESEAHSLVSLAPFLSSTLRYQAEASAAREVDRDGRDFSLASELVFKDVGFSYSAKTPVIENLNFTVKPGQIVGLIGPSGAGKTTLVDLLLRLYEPQAGQILLDGININEITLAEWRKNVGYVAQEVFLLNDTLENNIRFYDNNITAAAIQTAAAQAHCLEFINQLPQKFSTLAGERGMSLSGGERQRIALARVLARQPRLLILDEATSALDNESEIIIKKAIEELRGEITILVIAHRLSMVLLADTVVVLEQGKIIEQGRPEDLLKNSVSYFSKNFRSP